MLISCGQVAWASEIQMKAGAGINGQSKYNRYVPINVTIENGDSDFVGRIQIVLGSSPLEYSEEVQLAAGATESYMIPIRNIDGNYNTATVRLLDKDDNKILEKVVYIGAGILQYDQLAVGILSDDFSRLDYFRGVELRLDSLYQTRTLKLESSNIDEKVQNLDFMDILVINDYNTSQLLPEQLQAIKQWVNQGGILVVGTGVNGNKTLSGLSNEVIPITSKGTIEQTIQYLDDTITLDVAQLEHTGSEVQDHNQTMSYKDLYDAFSVGAGKVIVATYDLGLEPMVSYIHNQMLWKQILTNEAEDVVIGNGEHYYWSCNELTNVLSEHLPDYRVLIVILIIYLVVMGVVTYFILKKKQKKECIWIVAPILSIGTTAILYGLSMSSRLAPFMVNQLDLIQVDRFQNAHKVSHVGVLNTQGKTLVATETDGMQFSYIESMDRCYGEGQEAKITERVEYLGGKLQYQAEACEVYDTNIFVTEPVSVETPSYETSLITQDNGYEVQLTNNSEQKIKYLLVLSNENIWDLGTLECGQTVNQLLKKSDAKEIYEFIHHTEREEEDEELSNILEIVNDVYSEDYYTKTIYIAIYENTEPVLPILQAKYASDFNYTAVVGNFSLGVNKDSEIVYPYDYFSPYVVSQSGRGYIEEYGPVMTISEGVEVELDYPVIVDGKINWVEFGMNKESMYNYYYTDLRGQVYLYNYTTETYEEIEIPKVGKGYRIEHEQLEHYLNNHTIRLKIVSHEQEDSGLVPSIQVGGTAHVTN